MKLSYNFHTRSLILAALGFLIAAIVGWQLISPPQEVPLLAIPPAHTPAKKTASKPSSDPTADNCNPASTVRNPADTPAARLDNAIAFQGYKCLADRLAAISRELVALARSDGLTAMKLAVGHLTPGELDAVLPEVLRTWATSDPQSCLDWYKNASVTDSFPLGATFEARQALIDSAFAKIAQTDSAAALQHALSLETEGEQNMAISALSKAAVLYGTHHQLLQALAALPDENIQAKMSPLFAEWASFAPEEAVYALQQYVKPEAQSALVSTIARAWMKNQPVEAANWRLRCTPPDDRPEVISEIVSAWTISNPGQAHSWFSALPIGADRDAAAEAFAHAYFERSQTEGLRAAASITEPAKRAEVWGGLFASLYRSDPSMAAQIIKEVPDDLHAIGAKVLSP